ncbi:hypothetical protein [Furfurilactobacillus siliginis]|uniref:SAM-dependent methyltransferase n=1 Tax=Furfurilactobacillus siliginis TaxID=348151 RepID=A0A0R2L9H0_9LACO|nr:hypothetical protein [Furfurilactobacillus siliginis]KRN96453.1 hypothetical protein IV55_GL001425 [Furfurilactobacillus siliginis]GEK28915.1 hypothetical protein LSI01_12260 [Furfurilactobacillus siliginis]
MNPKQLRKLKKQLHPKTTASAPELNPNAGADNDYITQMNHFRDEFTDFSDAVFLINQVLEADRLLSRGLLPQPLPPLLLPDNFQDTMYQRLLAKYPLGDPRGDQIWNQLSGDLPQLDRALRNFREYLETTYGMWAYISAPFANDLSAYLNGRPTLEIMAGNGYISKGLRDHNAKQPIYTTDSKDWTAENETGKHPVTTVEQLDALAAIEKYSDQVAAVIMSWSPDGQTVDWDVLQALRKLPSQPELIVIGEKDGATDSTIFWQQATLTEIPALNKHFSHFDLLNDQVYIAK